jgi:hypothetical protein
MRDAPPVVLAMAGGTSRTVAAHGTAAADRTTLATPTNRRRLEFDTDNPFSFWRLRG